MIKNFDKTAEAEPLTGASSFHHFSPPRSRERFFYFVVAAAIFLDPSGGSSRSALWAPFLDPSGGSSRSALWAAIFRPVWWVIPLGPLGRHFFSSSLFHPSGFGTEPALPSGINPIKLYSTVRYHLQMIFLQGYIWPRGFLTIYIPGKVNILYSPRFFHIIYFPLRFNFKGRTTIYIRQFV